MEENDRNQWEDIRGSEDSREDGGWEIDNVDKYKRETTKSMEDAEIKKKWKRNDDLKMK